MILPQRSIFLVFDGFQLLDLAGPACVFSGAAEAADEPHEVVTASLTGGRVTSSCGIAVDSVAVADVTVRAGDTLLVCGGERRAIERLIADPHAACWFRQGAEAARRYGSICSGAFAVAAWGLADGHRVATHWSSAELLARRFPGADVDREAMFVEAGRLWTSAGVTAGIDMALAMVERDHGSAVAGTVARRLVLSARRPGRQSQFSPLLEAQAGAGGRYADLVAYIGANLAARLDVETLAARAGEAVRSFHRHFRAATGKTPAAFVEAARLDRARLMLTEGARVKAVAAACGFSSAAHLTRCFSAAFGLPPAAYRTVHGAA